MLRRPVESTDTSLSACTYGNPAYVREDSKSINFDLTARTTGLLCQNSQSDADDHCPPQTSHFTLNIPSDPEPFISNVLDIEPGMKDWFHEESPPHPFYVQYRMYQAKVLSSSARRFLSEHLNPTVDVGLSSAGCQRDWRGLADCMGKDHQLVLNLDRFRDPTVELLNIWQTEEGSTIGRLLHHLKQMDRFDVLEDIKFMDLITQCCRNYDLNREKELRKSSAEQNWTVGDVGTDEREKFDAFVCFSDEDSDFMFEMVEKLEVDDGINPTVKLCLDVRDILDHKNHTITANIIKERCKRTIVVLSKNFVREDNKLCEFAMRIAQSLSPAASHSKIIPILIDRECTVPTSLRHLTLVDYTRPFQRQFMWTKIAATLRNSQEQLYLVEQEKLSHVVFESNSVGANLRDVIREKHEINERRRKEEEESQMELQKLNEASVLSDSSSESSTSSSGRVRIKVVPGSTSSSSFTSCEKGKKYSEKTKLSIRNFFAKKKEKVVAS